MEEEQNQRDAIDTGLNIGKNIAKGGIHVGKKTTKKLGKKIAKQLIKWLIKILSNPLVWKILLIVAIVYIIFASAYYVVEEQKEKDPNDAAENAIAILESYSMSIGSNFNKNSLLHNYSNTSRSNSFITSRSNNQEVSSNTNNSNETLNRVVIEPNTDKTGYEITYKNDAEYLEEIRKYLKEDLNLKSEFNDLEVGILGALIDHGATLEHYNDEELHCFASFVKAEASTQYLDLRPNSQKIIDGEYVPRKIEDLAENEVPGTILVQRTNTNGNATAILEYMLQNDFNALKEAGDTSVLNYFTISDDGELIIAKWDKENIKVTIEGDGLPEDIMAEETAQDTGGDKYIITTEKIPYRQYIQKYTIPFEFFIQLLVVTTEPDFCMELVNHVLNSKIVINIQEQETFTQKDETKQYFVHIKDEKYIDYNITALPNDSQAKKLLEEKNNHFLNYMKDDENNDCTNYTYAEPIVKIHREYTSHSYSFEVIEADTWIAHFTKEYANGEVTSSTSASDSSIEGAYNDRTSNEIITDTNIINEDNNIKTFISQKKIEYEPKIIVPIVTVSDYTDNSGNKHKKINVVGGSINVATDYIEAKDDNGNGLGHYNLPSSLVVTTSPTTQIPSLQYSFKVNSDESGYNVQTNINPLIGVKVSKLDIKEFQKINLNSHIDTTVTRYQADSNPVTSTHIYATESGSPGKGRRDRETVYEKFLLAYHNSPGARNNLNSIDSWLYEMMEKRECTIELVDVVKYLLYMYDGKDRGVTNLEDIEKLFEPDQFNSINNGSATGWWWPIGSNSVSETRNGVEIYGGTPAATIVSSEFGYRGDIGIPGATKDHNGIDIGAPLGTPVIASADGVVEVALEGYNGGRGNYIIIDHENGIKTLYQHLNTVDVSVGQTVVYGQKIGTVGNTGVSGGAHLHFEVWVDGTPVNPLDGYVNSDNPRPVSSFYGNSLEDKVWWALIDAGYSKIAAAAVMGNLSGESSFNSNNLNQGAEGRLGYTDESYTQAVDNGTYTREEFINDSAAYGLAQWTYHSRKAGLYDFAKNKKNVSIADEDMQIEYLLGELSYSGGAQGCATCQICYPRGGYTSDDWEHSDSVEEATAAFYWLFENPGSEDKSLDKRKTKAREYYDRYKDAERQSGGTILGKADEIMTYYKEKKVEYSLDGVFIGDIEASCTHKYTCCATFVSCAIYKAGYFTEEQMNTFSYFNSESLYNFLYKNGWQKINNYNDLKAGDIAFLDTGWRYTATGINHVQIYAGDGTWYSAGSDYQIGLAQPYKDNCSSQFTCALRAPN